MDDLSGLFNLLFGAVAAIATGLAAWQGVRLRRDGAKKSIVSEVEKRREYVLDVYEYADWEATQHRYWEDAYWIIYRWVRSKFGDAEIPEREPYPTRPDREREVKEDG